MFQFSVFGKQSWYSAGFIEKRNSFPTKNATFMEFSTPRFQRTLAREGMSFVEIMRVLCECILVPPWNPWAEWTVQFT